MYLLRIIAIHRLTGGGLSQRSKSICLKAHFNYLPQSVHYALFGQVPTDAF